MRTVIYLPHTRELCLIPHQICDRHLSLQKGTVNTDVTTSPSQGLSSHLAKDAEIQMLRVHVCVCFLVLSCLLVSVLCNVVTSKCCRTYADEADDSNESGSLGVCDVCVSTHVCVCLCATDLTIFGWFSVPVAVLF